MKRVLLTTACLTSLLMAAEMKYDPQRGKMLALSCFSCHGTDGKSEAVTPYIAGMGRTTLYQILMDYKHGKLEATMMQKHAKGFSDEELFQVATYYSTVTR